MFNVLAFGGSRERGPIGPATWPLDQRRLYPPVAPRALGVALGLKPVPKPQGPGARRMGNGQWAGKRGVVVVYCCSLLLGPVIGW